MEYKIKLAYHNMEEIKELFQEYTKSLGFDLQFQNYEQEYKNLPGKYNVPKGRLYLLECNNQPAGCIALKPFQKDDRLSSNLFRYVGFYEKCNTCISKIRFSGIFRKYLLTIIILSKAQCIFL